jgi:hypothetical protein
MRTLSIVAALLLLACSGPGPGSSGDKEDCLPLMAKRFISVHDDQVTLRRLEREDPGLIDRCPAVFGLENASPIQAAKKLGPHVDKRYGEDRGRALRISACKKTMSGALIALNHLQDGQDAFFKETGAYTKRAVEMRRKLDKRWRAQVKRDLKHYRVSVELTGDSYLITARGKKGTWLEDDVLTKGPSGNAKHDEPDPERVCGPKL